MSKTIDERVVAMQFDNKQFEAGINTSMNSIDNLNKKLKLEGASKGLENVGSAAKKVDMSPIDKSLDSIKIKFSALEVVAMSTLNNLTNKAIATGERFIKSLTFDNVFTGWKKFGDETVAVGTLVSQGYDVSRVEDNLGKLSWFADETSYSFNEMLNSMSKFTASGQDLEKSMTALEGIANWAALSGQNSEKASHAMYQLSQALGAGVMKRNDYVSIQNVNMDTDEFRQITLDAAVALGTLRKNADGTYQSLMANSKAFSKNQFAESLTEGLWFTSDVMMDVFNKYSSSVDGIYRYTEKTGKTASETIRLISKINSQAKSSGKTAEQIIDDLYEGDAALKDLAKSTDEFGIKAIKASQEARTWEDVVNSVKEGVSSKWKDTFKILIGNYEQAKTLWTNLSEDLYDIFVEPINVRNNVLKEALNNNAWDKLANQVASAGVPIEEFKNQLIDVARVHGIAIDDMISEEGSFEDTLKNGWLTSNIFSEAIDKILGSADSASAATTEVTNKLKGLQQVVNQVIMGDFGNGQARIEALTAAGYDYATVQDLVNKTIYGETINYEDLSDAQLQNIGYTEEQIKILRDLSAQAKASGTDVESLINQMSKPTGRQLLISSFKNALQALTKVMNTVKEAWTDIFPANANGMYSALESLNKFTEGLIMSNKTANNFKNTLKGLFSIFSMVGQIVKTTLVGVFKILGAVLGGTTSDILSMTGSLGETITKFKETKFSTEKLAEAFDYVVKKINKFLPNGLELNKVFGLIVDTIQVLINWFKNLFDEISKADTLSDKFKVVFGSLQDVALKGFDSMRNAIQKVIDKIKEFNGQKIKKPKGFNEITEASIGQASASGPFDGSALIKLGNISSKTKQMVGQNVTDMTGEVKKASGIIDFFETVTSKLKDSINLGNILTVVTGVALIGAVRGLTKSLKTLTSWFDPIVKLPQAINTFLSSAAGALSSFAKAKKIEAYGKVVLDVAKAILLITTSIIAFALMYEKHEDSMNSALTYLAVLAGGLIIFVGSLALINKHISSVGGVFDAKNKQIITGMSELLLALGASLVLMAWALKISAGISWENGYASIYAMIGILAILAILIKSMSKDLSGKNTTAAMKGFSSMLLALSASLLILALVVKMFGKLDVTELIKGGIFVGAFLSVIIAMTKLTKNRKNMDKVAALVASFGASIFLLAMAVKILGELSITEVAQGVAVIAGLGFLIWLFTKTFPKKELDKMKEVAILLLGVSASLVLIGIAIKIIAGIDPDDIFYAGLVIAGLMVMIAILITYMGEVSNNAAKAGIAMLAISVAIVILAAAIILMSAIDPLKLIAPTIAITMLMGMFALILLVSKQVEAAKGTIIAISVIVGILALSLGLLSMCDPVQVLGAAAALSLVIFMTTLLVIFSKNASAALSTMIMIAIIIGVIGGVLILMSMVGAEDALKSALAMSAVMIAVSVLLVICVAIGALAEPALIGLAVVMLAIVAIFGLMEGIGYLSKNLKGSKENMEAAVEVFGYIGKALGALVGEFLGGAILGVINGFSAGIVALGEAFEKFGNSMSNMPSGVGKTVKDLAEALLIITAEKILSRFAGKGGNPIETFGKNIVKLGPYLKEFSDSVAGIDSKAVTASATAGQALADLERNLPKHGGKLQEWFGDATLKTFGEGLSEFADAIIGYNNKLIENGGIDSELIEDSATAAQALVDLEDNLPRHGGKLQEWFTGDATLKTFGKGLSEFADAIIGYNNKLIENGGINSELIEDSATAAQVLADLEDNLPRQGGVVGWFAGNKNLGTFGASLKAFGKGIKEYYDEVKDIQNAEQLKSVTEVASLLAKAASYNIDAGEFAYFGEALEDFGDQLTEFYDDVKSINTETVNATITNIKNLIDAGRDMVTKIKKGILDSKSKATSAIKEVVTATVYSIETTGFKNAGSNAGNAFANGLSSAASAAKKSAKSLVNAATSSMKITLQIHSPSRVFKSFGALSGEGYANGLVESTSLVANASSDLANSAIDSMAQTMDSLSNYVISDIDSDPVIRPVLDLSSIDEQKGTLESLFSDVDSINTSADLAYSINRNQNESRTYDDAIKQPVSSVSNSTYNNTFNIDGTKDPTAVANEVSRILQKQVERKNASWA